MIRKILSYLVVIILASGGGYFFGVNKVEYDWKNFQPNIQVLSKEPPPERQELDLSMLWTVIDKLEAGYYDKTQIDSQKMLNGAISGLVSSLEDPYTVYLPPKQNNDFKQGLAGKFEGIGAELGMREKQIVVVAPLDGSPAQKAGLKPGDAIVEVDEEPIFGLSINQVVERIRGPKGSSVLLSVVPKDQEKLKDVKIVRDTINVKSVFMWIKPVKEIAEINAEALPSSVQNSKVVYFRLSQFGDNTNQEWLSLINDLHLKMQTDNEIVGMVLDLRSNPGGYLTDAVFIASEFLPVGSTVVTQEDGRRNQVKMNVERRGLLQDFPLVILVNKGSASASEIVSGAMRDYDRATLIGETTFGKGTIQSAEDLGDGAGLHVTVAKWLTPKGTWVHKTGLEPDVVVEVDSKDQSRDAQLEKAIQEVLK